MHTDAQMGKNQPYTVFPTNEKLNKYSTKDVQLLLNI